LQYNLGEAIAARLDFHLASSLKLNRVIIEGDSQIVISSLCYPVLTQDWRIHSLLPTLLIPSRLASSRKLRKLIEVQTFVLTLWHIGP
jgi:hypothetical protein